MVKLLSSFRALKSIKVCVIGDFVLDTYVTGCVARISPEAPVPVLHAKEQKHHPGMAGNVALNLLSLGAEVFVCGRVGPDKEGKQLIKELRQEGIDVEAMVVQKKYRTSVKHRMIANAQQLLRVDFEEVTPLSPLLEKQLMQTLPERLKSMDVIALSDYKKGFLTERLIEVIIACAREAHIPLIVDPKGEDFSKYRGCTLIKPNLQEAYAAAKLPQGTSLDQVALALLQTAQPEYVLITRSEHGMSLFHTSGKREDFGVKSQEVKDVTGAGDTVLAMVTMGMGNRLDVGVCAQLANVAASIAIQKVGCARVSLTQVVERLLELDSANKVFAEEHLFALNQVLSQSVFSVLGLDAKQEMSTALFQVIKKLSGGQHDKLLVYLADTRGRDTFIALLASLKEVDFILLCSKSLSHVFQKMKPKQVFLMAQDKLREVKEPSMLLEGLVPATTR